MTAIEKLIKEVNGVTPSVKVAIGGLADGFIVGSLITNGRTAGFVQVFQTNIFDDLWTKIGRDIIGEIIYTSGNPRGDHFGTDVAISNNGWIVAIAAQFANNLGPGGISSGNGSGPGAVYIYEYGRGVLAEWNQIGQTIVNNNNDWNPFITFEKVLSMSSDGKYLAIGRFGKGLVNVYTRDVTSGDWVTIPTANFDVPVAGGIPVTQFGTCVSLSDYDETYHKETPFCSSDNCVNQLLFLAVGAPLINQIFVFVMTTNFWYDVGNNYPGITAVDNFGTSVYINKTADVVAGGSFSANGNRGYVIVYNVETGAQIGQTLHGLNAGDRFSTSISLSSDGNRISIGAPGTSSSTGTIYIYDYYDANWIIFTNVIGPGGVNRSFGFSSELSENGKFFIAGESNTLNLNASARLYQIEEEKENRFITNNKNTLLVKIILLLLLLASFLLVFLYLKINKNK